MQGGLGGALEVVIVGPQQKRLSTTQINYFQISKSGAYYAFQKKTNNNSLGLLGLESFLSFLV